MADSSDDDFQEDQTPKVLEASTPTLSAEVVPAEVLPAEVVRPPYLTANDPHRVYIITYSQADRQIFPTRQAFGVACVAAFGGGHVIKYFCSVMEPHENGGFHYHVAILLSESKRWKYARDYLEKTFGVNVNFSSSPQDHPFYEGAYMYVTKWDKNFFHGHVQEKHPKKCELDGGKRGAIMRKANTASKKSAHNRRREKDAEQEKKKEEKQKRRKRMDKLDVVDFIIESNIETDEELLSAGKSRRDEYGDRDMLLFLTNLGEKGRRDILRDAWKTKTSTEVVELRSKSRMDIIREVLSNLDNCVCSQKGMWLVLALDVCEKNHLEWKDVSNAFYDLLSNGRGKHRNIVLYGERNCAKTFLLEPLTYVFKNTFHTPPASAFGWLGVEDAQVIYLNDFRWKPSEGKKGGSISWDALLRLLEGHHCSLPAPMNSRSEHIKLPATNDVPVFCTSRAVPRFWKENENEPQTPIHVTENKMMDERWFGKGIHLTHVFEEDQKVDTPPCPFCFAKFVCGGR